MQRDMELVRTILQLLDEGEPGQMPGSVPEIEGYDYITVGYHCYLLSDAGLVEGCTPYREGGLPIVIPMNLTWAGHEFIDNAKHDGVWNEAKDAVMKTGGEASFSIWTQVLGAIVLKNLGLD